MRNVNRIAFILLLGGAIALPGLAQQRELARQPPGQSMHGMMQGDMMGMHGGGMGGMDHRGRDGSVEGERRK